MSHLRIFLLLLIFLQCVLAMPIAPTQKLILAFLDTVIVEWLEIMSHAQEQPIRVLLDPVFAEGMQSVQGTQTLALRAIVNVAQIMHAPAVLIPAYLEYVDVEVLWHALDLRILVPQGPVNAGKILNAHLMQTLARPVNANVGQIQLVLA